MILRNAMHVQSKVVTCSKCTYPPITSTPCCPHQTPLTPTPQLNMNKAHATPDPNHCSPSFPIYTQTNPHHQTMIIDPINFHHNNNMYSPQLTLLLLLIVVASNILCSASLVLPMVHSRSLATTISKKSSGVPLQSLDYMMEPLRAFRDGYLITLNLGSPPQLLQAYMDTGSDLTWVPCGAVSFDCVDCDGYKDYKLPSTFSPLRSSTSLRDLCTSPLCAGIHSSDNPYDACAVAGCSLSSLIEGTCPRPCPSFAYNYGAGGVVVGSLTRDTLRVHSARDPALTTEMPSFCFGCIGSSYREPIGIAGFGKGALSLPSQLGLLHKGFSHCFLPFKFANNPNISSPLVVGELANSSKENSHFTPMLKSPVFPNYYYIGLEGITVGNGSLIEVPSSLNAFDSEGNGGLLIDSGTTYTHLPEPLYDRLLRELGSKIAYSRAEDVEKRTGFDLCYKVPVPSSDGSAQDRLPTIAFHFSGNVELVLPTDSCFYAMGAPKDSMVAKCLLFQSMEDGDYGPAGVFGSFQQQNVEVVYDMERERIGFRPMDCASSADSHGLHLK